MAEGGLSPRVILRGVLLLASLAALAWLAEWMVEAGMLSEHWMDAQVVGHGWQGYATFLGVAALATGLGLPRHVIAFLGGYVFGTAVGTGMALAATVLGCIACFAYVRAFGRSLVARHLPGRVKQFDELLGLHPFQMTMIVRLLPVGSNVLTNVLAGVSRVRPWPFIAGSTVGYLPQTLAFVLAGSGVAVDPAVQITLAAVLFVVSALLGIALYRRHRHGAALEADIDRALRGEHRSEKGAF